MRLPPFQVELVRDPSRDRARRDYLVLPRPVRIPPQFMAPRECTGLSAPVCPGARARVRVRVRVFSFSRASVTGCL